MLYCSLMKELFTFSNLIYLVLSAVFVMLGTNFIKTTRDVINNSRRLDDAQNEVNVLKARQDSLNKDLEYIKGGEYLEQQARDALNLVMPNERVYVSDTDLNINPDTGTMSQRQIDSLRIVRVSGLHDEVKPYYRKWLELFL